MSLTPHDLIHGGFYRRKGSPDIIGRLDLKNPTKAIWIGENDFHFAADAWEPIPLTPEILKTFMIVRESSVMYWFAEALYADLKWDGRYLRPIIDLQELRWIEYVHELQRLHLALAGKPLEGGPHA